MITTLADESAYRITATAGQPDSMLLALLAVCRAAGRVDDYEDLAGASGLAWLASWADSEPCPAHQGLTGRASLLASAGPALGIQLRSLIASGEGPGCPRLADHFRDSFLPLVRLAIEHNQPVLCRGGLAAEHLCAGDPPTGADVEWCIVTRLASGSADESAESRLAATRSPDEVGTQGSASTEPSIPLAGFAVGAEHPAPLDALPAQMFVVESVNTSGDCPLFRQFEKGDCPPSSLAGAPQMPPDWDGLLSASLRIAARLGRSDQAGAVFGSAALRSWRAQLGQPASPGRCPGCDGEWFDCHRRLAARLYFRRLAGYEFICRHGQSPPRAVREACMQLEPLLARQIELLDNFRRGAGAATAAGMVDELIDLEDHFEQVLHELDA